MDILLLLWIFSAVSLVMLFVVQWVSEQGNE